MYCQKCGALNPDNAAFCAQCGFHFNAPVQPQYQQPQYQQPPMQPPYPQQSPMQQPIQPQYVPQGGLRCKKCGSPNVRVEVINQVKLKNRHHGFFWWLCIGWWWVPIKWICFTGWALLFKIFGHKKQKTVNKQHKVYICQNCGYTWN